MHKSINDIFVIAKKDFLVFVRNKRFLLIFLFSLSLIPVFVGYTLSRPIDEPQDIVLIAGYTIANFITFIIVIIGFIGIVCSVPLAAESFSGEKEKGTIQHLISTPVSNTSIFWGKYLVSVCFPIILALYGITVMMLTACLFGSNPKNIVYALNNAIRILLILPPIAFFAVALVCLISSYCNSVKVTILISGIVLIILTTLLVYNNQIIYEWNSSYGLYFTIFLYFIAAGTIVITSKIFRRNFLNN